MHKRSAPVVICGDAEPMRREAIWGYETASRPAVTDCSRRENLLPLSARPIRFTLKIPQELFSESAAILISYPPPHTHTQVLPPNQTQTCLPSAWMSSIRLAARWASQAPYSKLHYKVACLCTTFPLQVTALILRAQSCSKHTLNSLTYADT